MGNDVYIIAMKSPPDYYDRVAELEQIGIKVFYIGSKSNLDAILKTTKLRNIIKSISKGETDVIVNMHLKIGVLVGVIATLGMNNLVRIETYHSMYRRYGLQINLLKPFIKKYIAVSKGAALELIKKFGINEKKVVSLYNGIDNEKVGQYLSKCKKSESKLSLLSVGRFTEQKQFNISVKGFIDSGIDAIYEIVGDGPDYEEVKNIIGDDSEQVLLPGNISRDEVFKKIDLADFIIMPSKHEGNSIFLLEAMAMDKPLMLADIESFREVVKEQPIEGNEDFRVCTWGYLVKNDGPHCYSNAIKYMAEHRDLIPDMMENVKEISKDYDIKNVAVRYVDEYKKII